MCLCFNSVFLNCATEEINDTQELVNSFSGWIDAPVVGDSHAREERVGNRYFMDE